MSRFHSYLSSAKQAISTYKRGEPLSHHLKQFFSTNKKYGSRDRKQISALCYGYFRCAHLFSPTDSIESVILNALFLCDSSFNDMLDKLQPELNEQIRLPLEEKLTLLNIENRLIFKFSEELSSEIESNLLGYSFLKQPSLFLRVRPGNLNKVTDKLIRNQIVFEVIGEDNLKCNNATKIDDLLLINKEVVVQDLNSQHVLDFLKEHKIDENKRFFSVWDACAASGGKSILIYDLLKGKVKLTASDIRENILSNYTFRLQQAGINIYRKFVQNLAATSGLNTTEKFNIVICDVPCTGSGTWSRNPEQYFSFDKSSVSAFSKKQKEIVNQVIPHLQDKGLFFYITCSVFKSENEEVVTYIRDTHKLECLNQTYLKGYEKSADTMFVAVFQL